MMRQYFEQLVAGIESSIQADPTGLSPRKRHALDIARLGVTLYTPGEHVAWCGVTAPFDLLRAMDVTSCFVEFVGAMLASTGAIVPLLEIAERGGFATDSCGYHRAVIGATLAGQMPVPDFLIGTTCPCIGGLATIENLARIFQKDLFVLHVPQEDSPRAVAYLSDQMRDLASFVAAHTGRPLDLDRLREVIDLSNLTAETMREVYRLAAHVPSPASSADLRNFGIVMPLFFGTPDGLATAEFYREQFAARIARGQAGVAGEQLRLLWIQNRIQFKNPLEKDLASNARACIVADELNTISWEPIDPADPFPGLARRAISIPFNGTIARRVRHLQDMARDFRIDGAINPCHWGCRQGTGGRGLVAEGLAAVGVPTLNLEVDCVDTRSFAEGQLKTRLEAFLEMVASRPSPWV